MLFLEDLVSGEVVENWVSDEVDEKYVEYVQGVVWESELTGCIA
jgi:hypothetical protein